ncbi:MAG: hypothetical protein F6K10_43600, partial [Moorea sp. SIO2B7]|nr:hypothetical protein [Moorena sp. SIO2B7]
MIKFISRKQILAHVLAVLGFTGMGWLIKEAIIPQVVQAYEAQVNVAL